LISWPESNRKPAFLSAGLRQRAWSALLAATFIAGLARPAAAHHSEAAFDMESVVAFRGTVTAFNWRNPHVYIEVEADSGSGNPTRWQIETGATPLLARSGWSPNSLAIGEQIAVRAHPARDPSRQYSILIALEKTDGTVLRQVVTNSEATAAADSIAGVWKGNTASLADLAEGFESMPATPKGAAAQASYDVNVENPAASCVAYSTPAIIVASGFFLSKIELREDAVVLRNEWFDAERIIYTDGRGHPTDGERTVQGHSIGHWEDGALVVDTTLFADHRSPYQTGVPSGARKHVVERYALAPDGRTMAVDFTLEDPEYLAEPFTGHVEWVYRPDLQFFRFGCDPAVSSEYVPK
jgi:hypothetical protein